MQQSKNIFLNRTDLKRRRRVYTLLSVVLALFIMAFSITPFIIKSVVTDWLAQQGATNSSIDDVDFNYFTLTLELEKINFEFPGQQPLTIGNFLVNLDWLPLVSDNLFIKELKVRDANINVTENQQGIFSFNGLTIPTQSSETQTTADSQTSGNPTPWQFGIGSLALTNTRIDFERPDLKSVFNINSFTVSDLAQWLPGQSTLVAGSILINNAPLNFKGELRPFGEDKPLQLKLTAEKLDLVPFEKVMHADQFKLATGALSVDFNIDSHYSEDKQYAVKLNGNIALIDTNAQLAENVIDVTQLAWDGKTELLINKFSGKSTVFSKSNVNIENLQLENQLTGHKTTLNQYTWAGNATINTDPGKNEEKAHITGAASISGFKLADTTKQLVYATFDLLDIPGFEFSLDKRLEIPALKLTNTRLLGDHLERTSKGDNTHYLSSIKLLELNGITLSFDNALLINTVSLTDINNHVIRQKDGSLRHLAKLSDRASQASSKASAAAALTKENASPPSSAAPAGSKQQKKLSDNIRIGTIKTQGTNQTLFKDFSVKPNYESIAKNVQFTITALDSSSTDKRAQLEFKAEVDEISSVNITGNIQPFTNNPTYDLKVKLNTLELHPLSPYALDTIGYNIKRGELSIESTININNQQLKSQNKIYLKGLNFVHADQKKAESFSAELPMTLEASLDLLRDDKNNINLTIPVNGNLDSPNFELASAINKAVGKSLQSSMIAYLSYTLQPWGAILYAGNLAKNTMQKISLSPIEFKSGQRNISKDTRDYIDKIADLMKKKPDLNITLCGVTTLADRDTLLKQSKTPKQEISESDMITLAKQRAKAVRVYLIKNKNIDPSKISNCKAAYRTANNSIPSVEIIL